MGFYPGLWPGVPPVSEQPLTAQESGLASEGLQGESEWSAHAGGSGERDAAARKAQKVLEGRINKSKQRRGAGKTAGPSRANVNQARRQEQLAADRVPRALALHRAPPQPFFGLGQPCAELVQPSGVHEQAFVDLTHSPEATEPSSGGQEHSTEQEPLQQEQVMKEQEQDQVPEDDDADWDVEFLQLFTEDNSRTDDDAAEMMRYFEFE
ncbi:MAG: hypothetical protein LQ347_006839 [Umbilicaria vellea]|nr:MAG: hypothetical protein LQ347_006839 [Umbilicaria vellea]